MPHFSAKMKGLKVRVAFLSEMELMFRLINKNIKRYRQKYYRKLLLSPIPIAVTLLATLLLLVCCKHLLAVIVAPVFMASLIYLIAILHVRNCEHRLTGGHGSIRSWIRKTDKVFLVSVHGHNIGCCLIPLDSTGDQRLAHELFDRVFNLCSREQFESIFIACGLDLIPGELLSNEQHNAGTRAMLTAEASLPYLVFLDFIQLQHAIHKKSR